MQGNVWNIFDHDNTMAKTARFYYELISITTLVDVSEVYDIQYCIESSENGLRTFYL